MKKTNCLDATPLDCSGQYMSLHDNQIKGGGKAERRALSYPTGLVLRSARDATHDACVPRHRSVLHRRVGRAVLLASLPMDVDPMAVLRVAFGSGDDRPGCECRTRCDLLEELSSWVGAIPYVFLFFPPLPSPPCRRFCLELGRSKLITPRLRSIYIFTVHADNVLTKADFEPEVFPHDPQCDLEKQSYQVEFKTVSVSLHECDSASDSCSVKDGKLKAIELE